MTRIIVDTHEYGDPRIRETSERVKRLVQEAAIRRGRRVQRELAATLKPAWLDSVDWSFPTWPTPAAPFDWRRSCPFDLVRRFPPIVGPGRGVVMNAAVSLRDTLLWLQGRDGEVDPKALRILNARQRDRA